MVICCVGIDLLVGSLVLPRRETAAHPYYHHGLKPLINQEINWGDTFAWHQTDGFGFRVSASLPRQDPALPNLLILGDSFLEGLGVVHEKTIAGLLADEYRDRLNVVNGGSRSYSPLIYRLRYRYLRERRDWRADALVVMLDISDIQDEVQYEGFQPYAGTARAYLRGLDTWLREHSILYQNLLRPLLEFLRRQWAEPAASTIASNIDPNGKESDYYWIRRLWTEDEKYRREWGYKGLRLAGEQLIALRDYTRADGTRMALVVYPWPTQIKSGRLDSLQVTHWREFCRRNDIPFIDLFPLFLNQPGGPAKVIERYFIPGDVHWNEAGHALMARELERELSRIGFL